MTKSNKVQNNRYNTARDEAAQEVLNKYGEEAYQEFLDMMGSNRSQTGFDWAGIHKSGNWSGRNQFKKNALDYYYGDWTKEQLNKYLQQNFIDPNWINNYWSNSADDEMINNYVNEKYTDAQDQLERAYKRGLLTDTSYYDALNELDVDKSIMYNTAQDYGNTQLQTYRDDLNNLQSGFNDIVDQYTKDNYGKVTADNFDKQINDLYAEQQNGFYNNMIAALDPLGGFDVSGIIGDARVAAGVGNNQSNELVSAIEDTNKKKDQQIGLGNQGMF